MAGSKKLQILHISDLHINESPKTKFDRSVVLDPLIDRVRKDRENGFCPEIVVVTGDIAYKGAKPEYDLAKEFLDDLLEAVGIDNDRLFIVPGNHDVDRKKYRPKDVPQYETMEELNTELENEDYRADLFKGMRDYFDFTETQLPHLDSVHGRLVPFVNTLAADCGKRIGLVGLNSAWMCRKSPDERTIAIGEFQVNTAMEALSKKGNVDLRIICFHHPIDWLWPVDRKICRSYLKDSVLLCGHLHDAEGGYLSDLDGNLYRFQAGAAYLGSESRWPSRFHYVTFDWAASRIELDFRKYVKDKRKWSIDGETGDDGSKAFEMLGMGREEVPPQQILPDIPESYSGWINDQCTYMDVGDLQVEGKPIRIELPEIFIPLRASETGTELRAGHLDVKRGTLDVRGDLDIRERYLDMRKEAPLTVEELVGKHEYLVIEGDAGSGKTTVLKHLAYCVASDRYDEVNLETFERCLPVLILLKDLQGFFDRKGEVKDEHVGVEAVLSYYFKTKEDILDFETVKAFCRAKKALFLLDGLDEMAAEHRTLLISAFSNFKNKYRGNRMVLSGRPHGLIGPAMDKFGKHHVRILPLTMEQVETYIRKWFQYIYTGSSGLSGKTAEAMISEIKEHQAIEQLIENPLMLTATCILYHGGKELPGQRAELYKKFVSNLLHRRFDEPEKIREFLIKLAYSMHKTGSRGADKVFAVEQLETVYERRENETAGEHRNRVEKLFEDIEPKCGLLKFENGQYSFRHLTFQEFLTALYVVDNHTDYGKAVEAFWDKEAYKEVIELYVGYLSIDNKRWANRVVEDVLNRKDSGSCSRWRLAARSLLDIQKDRREIDVVDLATERLRTVIESGALPKDLVDAGETLGRLGDRRDLEKFIPVKEGTYELESGKVRINPFEMAKYPVTNHWFGRFMADDGYKQKKYWSNQGQKWLDYTKVEHPRYWRERGWNCPNSPLVGVCWYEADAFCRWLTVERDDGHMYGLPGANQWEAVAAGLEKRKYPWGDHWDAGNCNTEESKIGKTSPVGIFAGGDTPEGISDLAGNVWEWTRTDYHSERELTDFRFDEDLQKTFEDKKMSVYVSKLDERDRQLPLLRGGSWIGIQEFARCADRYWVDPGDWDFDVGFRCVRTSK